MNNCDANNTNRRITLREVETEGALEVMDRNARYLERQGHANAARRTREAIAGLRELVMAARLARNVLDSYGLRGGAMNALDDALARVQGEG